jgi:hypothetical protein
MSYSDDCIVLPSNNALEKARNFHPRAMKLIAKKKKFLVVACDEPYYLMVYQLIKEHELKINRWTDEDEQLYLSEVERIEKDEGMR